MGGGGGSKLRNNDRIFRLLKVIKSQALCNLHIKSSLYRLATPVGVGTRKEEEEETPSSSQ